MLQRTNKLRRSTKGMEIVEAPKKSGKPEPRQDRKAQAQKDNGFTIVETVTGPVAGTFGLSDVWDRN